MRGPDPRYWRYDAILARFEAWERERPDIFRRETIGRTHAGEAIVAARVSRNVGVREVEPAVLLHAAQHANEPAGTGALMILLEDLLDGYGQDARATALVDGLDLWVVPVVNVDGHRRVFAGGPGWREWRKNGREPDGVDLNRNWDHRWAEDPSTDPASRNYKGPHPFSEPETRAIRDLVLREMPVLVLDMHSPGTITAPNRIFWPWLFRASDRLGPDAEVFHDVASEIAARTETETDGVFSDGDGYAYDTLPKEQNWVYAKTGICVLLMEVGDRFWWSGPMVDVLARRTARGCHALLERALEGPGLTGRVVDSRGKPLVAEIRVEGAHDPAIGPRLSERRLGAYWRLLLPGEVEVTVRAPGHRTSWRRLRILETGWTTADFILER
jgi:hypothetical protein